MSSAAATNIVQPAAHSRALVYGGISVNADIPVGSVELWRTEAIQKVIAFGKLPHNWDVRGSAAPGLGVRQAAIELLMRVPSVGAPRIVPTSAGGCHFEWSVGERELEISLEPNCRLEVLQVEHGMPLEEDPNLDLSALFGWLISE